MIQYIVMAIEENGPGVRLFAANNDCVADILCKLLTDIAKVGGKSIKCSTVPVYEFCQHEVDAWMQEMEEELMRRTPPATPSFTDLFPRTAYDR